MICWYDVFLQKPRMDKQMWQGLDMYDVSVNYNKKKTFNLHSIHCENI